MKPYLFALGLIGLGALNLSAQPNLRARPFSGAFGGVSQEQFLRSNLGIAAGKLTQELTHLRNEVTRLPVPMPVRFDLSRHANQAVEQAERLQRMANTGANLPQLVAQDQAVDRVVDELLAKLQKLVIPTGELTQIIARAQYADSQLHQILAGNPVNPLPPGPGIPPPPGNNFAARRLARLAESTSSQAEILREMVQNAGGDAVLDRGIREFARRMDRIHFDLEGGATLAHINGDYVIALQRWQGLALALTAAVNTRADIRLQYARVDQMFGNFREALRQANGGGVVPLPPIVPPVPGLPLPLPGPGFLRPGMMAIGAGEGGGPRVRILADVAGTPVYDFFAYDPNFRGGVKVAMADVNGDGVLDLITAPGPGMPSLVRVFDGRSMQLASEFLAYDAGWQGGVTIAASSATPTTPGWVATGTDLGAGPHVKIFDMSVGREVASFFAFPEGFRGGVRVALGDVNGDGVPDIVVAPGPGMEPLVRIYNGVTRLPIREFLAFERNFINGVNLAVSDITRNGRHEIVVSTDAGAPTRVRVFDGLTGQNLFELNPFPGIFRGGVRVACQDMNGDGFPDVLCAPGPDPRFEGQPMRIFDGRNRRPIGLIGAFEPSFRGGYYVGSR